MKTRTALLELFKACSGWRAFFRTCCETSAFGLRSQAWQFREELNERGHRFTTEEVEDALLGLAQELLSESPAAQWDAKWAYQLCRRSLARLAERHAEFSGTEKEALDLSGLNAWDERMHAAGLANDPAAFRVAIDGWTRAGLEAMEQIRVRGGAA